MIANSIRMNRVVIFIELLLIACGKPTPKSESKADSLRLADSIAAANANKANPSPQTTESEVAEGDPEYKSEAGHDTSWSMYAGEYTLQSSSEAEAGSSLTLTYVNGSTFTISITKMVADFCSGTISGEVTFDSSYTATFEADGHPVTLTFTEGPTKIEVQDPERQLGVGTCEHNGTFININAD